MENLKFNEVKKGDVVTYYCGIEFYKEVKILSDNLDCVVDGVESVLMKRDFKENHVFKALVVGNEYLIFSKSYGQRKATFKGFEFVGEHEFAKFHESETDLSWLIPVLEITGSVHELVTVF